MIFSESNYKFMFAALQEAQYALDEDEIPIGAVVIHDDKIIGRGRNLVEKLNDATAHAEIVAITAASNSLQSKYLPECDLYVTAEPCLMCSGAILLAKLRSVYFSTFEPKFGAAGSLYNLLEDEKYNHKVKVYSGIYENESKLLLENFFKSKREKK